MACVTVYFVNTLFLLVTVVVTGEVTTKIVYSHWTKVKITFYLYNSRSSSVKYTTLKNDFLSQAHVNQARALSSDKMPMKNLELQI